MSEGEQAEKLSDFSQLLAPKASAQAGGILLQLFLLL